MFDLGVPFGLFVVYAVLWIGGYFLWAYFRGGEGGRG
jgi:hypothetical protein